MAFPVLAAAGLLKEGGDKRRAKDAQIRQAQAESNKAMFSQMMDAILAGKERREERVLQAGQPNMGAFKQLYGSGM